MLCYNNTSFKLSLSAIPLNVKKINKYSYLIFFFKKKIFIHFVLDLLNSEPLKGQQREMAFLSIHF